MDDIINDSLNRDQFHTSGGHIPKITSRPPLHSPPQQRMPQISVQDQEIFDDDDSDDQNLSNYEETNERDDSENSDSVDSAQVGEDVDEEEIKEKDAVGNNDKKERDISQGSSSSIKLFSLLAFLVVIASYCQYSTSEIETTETVSDISTIKTRFPEQDEDLWIAFESGVSDVVALNRPSNFILLYDKTSEKKIEDLISELSKFAICKIRQCNKTPINLTDSKLNSPEILHDYGSLIVEYRAELEDKGVMVIRNLDKIRGISAQAFHTFCDEFTPLVQKSLFIFTMKVDKLPENNPKWFVEKDLLQRWNEVKYDTLVALIVRITSMVLKVV